MDSLTGGDPAALALLLVAGLGAWIAGLRVAARDRGALALAGPALFLGAWPLPDAGGALAFTAALTFGATAPALAATAALLHPRPPARRRDARVCGALAAAALIATGIWLGLLATMTFD